MRITGFGRGSAALRGGEAETLELAGKLAEGFGLIAGEDEWSFDGLEGRAGGQTSSRSRILGQRELLSPGRRSLGLVLRRDVSRRHSGLGMNDVLDGSDATDGFLSEDA